MRLKCTGSGYGRRVGRSCGEGCSDQILKSGTERRRPETSFDFSKFPAVRKRLSLGLRSGSHWRDLPGRYGKWKTVHRRFSRWCHTGVWERVFEALTADRDNKYLMLDSTIVGAHQQAASGKGGKDQALGRSRGGLTSKIHMLADALGRPLRGCSSKRRRSRNSRKARLALLARPLRALLYIVLAVLTPIVNLSAASLLNGIEE